MLIKLCTSCVSKLEVQKCGAEFRSVHRLAFLTMRQEPVKVAQSAA
jgi:hypothetical protein